MFIQTEVTPNPASLKFLPGLPVLDQGGRDFPNPASAAASPLARRLFAVDGVAAVYLGRDFVTVSKDPTQDWGLIKPLVLGALMDHFTSGEPVLDPAAHQTAQTAAAQADAAAAAGDPVVARILDLLDNQIRPVVAQDGGDIVFQAFADGIVYLRMKGSCSGCPSATATLKQGVERLLCHYIPEVRGVQAVL